MTDENPTPVDPARVRAALEVLGWPDDRKQREPFVEPRAYWETAEDIIRAADAASSEQHAIAGGYDDEARQTEIQDLLDESARAFAKADTSSERVEVIRDLLAGWYAAWPTTAVTDEHVGIAHQIVALVYAAEARVSTPPTFESTESLGELPRWEQELIDREFAERERDDQGARTDG